ncbi:MAG TPA: 4'-phosphopantetheinyl transferase superfamily protein [Actinomycetota bacterium]|nr:4'-phosphopantetheinyl transferase superfamily protein [Actinomycetota bacterium]
MDVWRIAVRRPAGELARLLSPEEAERARGFGSESARDAFVTARARLRTIAGSYLGVAPEDVVFGYGAKGKPELPGLSFNVSHAGDVVLAAFAPAGRVGVDVEAMDPDVPVEALARRFFTEAENAALSARSGGDLVRSFYGCWTRKEAFVKALGEGLSFGLGRVEVSVPPAPARVLSVDGNAGAAGLWTMADVDAGPGYAAAVAIDVPGSEVVVRDWSESAAA